MGKFKPGMIHQMAKALEALKEPFNQLADALCGVTLRRSQWVRRGEIVRLNDAPGGRVIVMHPLDAIAAEFPRDYVTQSEEVAAYFADDACRQLDRLRERLDDMAAEGDRRQAARLDAWLTVHGIPRERIIAARVMKTGRDLGLPPVGTLRDFEAAVSVMPGVVRELLWKA